MKNVDSRQSSSFTEIEAIPEQKQSESNSKGSHTKMVVVGKSENGLASYVQVIKPKRPGSTRSNGIGYGRGSTKSRWK